MATVQSSASGRYALIRDDVIFSRNVAIRRAPTGTTLLVLAQRPIQHDPPLLDQDRGAYRHEDRPSGSVSLPDRLRQIRQVSNGAGCLRPKPLGKPQTRITRVPGATKNTSGAPPIVNAHSDGSLSSWTSLSRRRGLLKPIPPVGLALCVGKIR
jgi:hypothetical protein